MRHFLDQKRNKRPSIHTFICVNDGCMSVYSLDDSIITEWANVWIDAGWDPVVLTENDAKRHPKYNDFIKRLADAKLPPIRWYRYLRYMAMSMQEDGGWYAETSVIPLYRSDASDGKRFELPNEGKFTTHYGNFPHLLSANNEGWTRITSAIIDDHELKTDIALLSTQNRKWPGLYFKEDSIINANHILDSDLKPKLNCTVFDSKLATIIPDLNMDIYTQKDYYNAINTALTACNPTIYTFFQDGCIDKVTELDSPTDVNEWKKAWKGAGWNPVVLNLEDAKRHPRFKEMNEILDSGHIKNLQYEKMCYYRWLAVAAKGGGWMADYDTYPLHIDPTIYGHALPNGGKFTSHCSYSPCIMSASGEEWNRVIPLMMHNLKKHNDQHWSDMLSTRALIQLKFIISERNYVNIHEVHNNAFLLNDGESTGVKLICKATKGKLAVHFSHFSCNKAEFCDKNRDTVLNKWLDHWKKHCA